MVGFSYGEPLRTEDKGRRGTIALADRTFHPCIAVWVLQMHTSGPNDIPLC